MVSSQRPTHAMSPPPIHPPVFASIYTSLHRTSAVQGPSNGGHASRVPVRCSSILWPMSKDSRQEEGVWHQSCGCIYCTNVSLIMKGIIVQNITSHYTEKFNTELFPKFTTNRLPLLGSSAIPLGPLRLPTVCILFPWRSKMERQ